MRTFALIGLVVLAPTTARAQDGRESAPPSNGRATVELGTGIDYEQGEYGTGHKLRKVSLVNSARLGAGRWEVAATLPYTRLDGPANAVVGSGLLGLPVVVDPTRPTTRDRREGLGDASVGASYRLPVPLVELKVSGQVKLPTASPKLGTGKTDYGIAVQASRTIGIVKPFVAVAYTIPGEPDGYALRNGTLVSGGVAADLGTRTRAYVSFSQGQSVDESQRDRRQVATGVTTALANGVALGTYATAGLSQGSAELGAVISIGLRIK